MLDEKLVALLSGECVMESWKPAGAELYLTWNKCGSLEETSKRGKTIRMMKQMICLI
jgi:hypothetical protein